MTGLPRLPRAHRMLAVLLMTASALLTACDSPAGGSGQGGGHLVVEPPTADSISAQGKGLPTDPTSAAEVLVGRIETADPGEAAAAAGELLRRSGVPLVAGDGSVVATPDATGLMLINQPVYVEFLWSIARAARENLTYDADSVARTLSTATGVAAAAPGDAVLAMIENWGKEPGDPVISVYAGAAVRALGAHHQALYHAGSSNARLDMLSLVLLAAHLAGVAVERKVSTSSDVIASGPILYDLSSDCEQLKKLLDAWGLAKNTSKATQVALWNSLIDSKTREDIGKALAEAGEELLGAAKGIAEKAAATLDAIGKWFLTPLALVGTAIMLLTGLSMDVNNPEGQRGHFRHVSGDHSKDFHFTAKPVFDPSLGKKKSLACYQLAGMDLPDKPGVLSGSDGWYVKWAITSGVSPAIVQPQPKDVPKTQNIGQPLEPDGTSHITIYPRTEKHPPASDACTADAPCTPLGAFVQAFLLKKPGGLDIFSGIVGAIASEGESVASGLLQKIIDEISLPVAGEALTIDYHGPSIYVIKGTTAHFTLLMVDLPLMADLYSCTGLKGPWHGRAGTTVTSNGWTAALAALAGKPVPPDTPSINEHVDFTLDPNSTRPQRVDIVPWGIQLQVTINKQVKPGMVASPAGTTDFYSSASNVTFDTFNQLLGGINESTVYPIVAEFGDARCNGIAAPTYDQDPFDPS